MAASGTHGRPVLGVGLCVLLGAIAATTEGCTVVLVGRHVTADGSVMIAHTDDSGSGTCDLRLVKVPAGDYEEGDTREVHHISLSYPRLVTYGRGEDYEPADPSQTPFKPAGHIPQVPHTYAYYDHDYGLMNEMQVSIAESTAGAKTVGWGNNLPYGYNMFGIAELTKVALERCATARCAVQLMGDLAVEHGFYSEDSGDPNHPEYAFSSETAGVADKTEAWIFHVLTGPNNASAVWAAVRVPDNHVAAIANGFVIRELDLDDPANYLASPDVHSFAIEQGWWRPENGPFDFTAAYAFDGDFEGNYPFYPLYVGRRVWRVFDLLAPSQKLDPRLGFIPWKKTYPVTIEPDRDDLGVEDVMSVLRDYYSGTDLDTSAGLKSGPFNSPLQYDPNQYHSRGIKGGWERPIAVFRQLFSYVCVGRSWLPDEIGGMFWFGQAQAHTTVYTPFYPHSSHAPNSYRHVFQAVFSQDTAWWAFDFVSNWAGLKYSYMIQDIRKRQAELEGHAFKEASRIEAKALQLHGSDGGGKAVAEYLTQEANDVATSMVAEWWKLAWVLVAKYADGYILNADMKTRSVPGYPKEWLDTAGFTSFPGNSFIDPRDGHEEATAKATQADASLDDPYVHTDPIDLV